MQQSLQSEDHLSLEDAGFGSPEPSVGAKRSLTRASLRKPLRSPPRPSPASVTYSDEDDTKGYDDHCDSSSLTEKPSEMSSSDSQVGAAATPRLVAVPGTRPSLCRVLISSLPMPTRQRRSRVELSPADFAPPRVSRIPKCGPSICAPSRHARVT